MFKKLNGSRRQGVIVRHCVKRTWEKLGVWNPEWGFAGRKLQPSDNARKWKWTWQQHTRPTTGNSRDLEADKLITRALHPRQNLKRGEYAPVIPQSRLGQNATVAQAEAFLISRPWFIFQIELAEERTRYERLSISDRRRYPHSVRRQVIQWWKERGDWRDEFDRTDWVTSWKWRHESPEPEPEDLTPIHNAKENPLEATEMEFTPSEIDELETINLPRSQQPEGFWVTEEGDLPPFFPGQMSDEQARVAKSEREKLEKARAEGREYTTPVSDGCRHLLKILNGRPLFPALHLEETTPEIQEDLATELQENASESPRDAAFSPPQRKRHLRPHSSQDGVDNALEQDRPPPIPRRSARIASMKRSAEPLTSQTAPNKRPRARAVAAPIAQPRQGRRRPRKENEPSMGSAVGKKTLAGKLAPAGTGGTTGADAPGVHRRPGRLRKTK
ncbi:hypothetical protein F4819DRAFT_460262 [Hypoxylon fuscum]|nr:hypothetical protein F4819DRAFT_460262 [Hypoxylon fuscum]